MKILFPVVRFTDVSSVLAPLVKNMALMFKAEIHVLRVEPLIDQFIDMRVKEADEWLDEFIVKHFEECEVSRAPVVPGDPAVEILKYIDEHEIDCVIIGTHGRKGLSGILFGTVVKDIVGRSPVPVLSINPYLITKDFKKRNATYLGALMEESGIHPKK
ncbi:universal stress protein [uncultured Desulfosarcina sp.]|uniref:universal stress protein n=1 Tax=uncultured Desulfosarcina sp. TaxID=218289 RepID=UPI0029C763D9|nr:universal stress protein [uncultured Desulfosarcina sp.]